MLKTAIVTALLLASGPALAGDRVNLNTQIKDPDSGKTVPDVLDPDHTKKCGTEGPGPCLTLGRAIWHALLRPYDDETNTADPIKGEAKYLRGALAYRLYNKNTAEFTPDEVKVIKLTVGKLYSPSIVVQVYQAIDPGLNPREDGK